MVAEMGTSPLPPHGLAICPVDMRRVSDAMPPKAGLFLQRYPRPQLAGMRAPAATCFVGPAWACGQLADAGRKSPHGGRGFTAQAV